jgi:hypothetical protein
MQSRLKYVTMIAGIAAMLSVPPVALANAAASGRVSAVTPSPAPFPGQSCSVNQGLFPGIQNAGPTGPLGPLGPQGPLGANGSLPCGSAVFNLGPGGPLGPGGLLGPSQPTSLQPTPAPQVSQAPHPSSTRRAGRPKHAIRVQKHGKRSHRRSRASRKNG